jgi:hypothetical protein
MPVERAYDSVHTKMLEAFPELRPAHERFLADWALGEPPGEYIHLDLLDKMIELCLLRQPSPKRDALLSRAFAFIEQLVASPDSDIRDLGYVGVLESRAGWWYFRARDFFGSASSAQLDQYDPDWRSSAEISHGVVPPNDARDARRSDPWGVEQIVDLLVGRPAAQQGAAADRQGPRSDPPR